MLASFATMAVALAAEPESGGLPQLNPDDFSPQLIWLAITFTLLFVLLSKVVLPNVGGVLEERAQRIQRDLDEAERMKLETEKALSNYESSLSAARQRAGLIAKDIRDKLAAEVDAERGKVEAQIAARVAEAEKSITDTKTRAMAEVGQIATETTEAIVSQLTGSTVSQDEVRQAVRAVAGE
ncbi:MAG: F0F1 ATP synthase subunit B' [Hyphomicrobiaceae bacterium]